MRRVQRAVLVCDGRARERERVDNGGGGAAKPVRARTRCSNPSGSGPEFRGTRSGADGQRWWGRVAKFTVLPFAAGGRVRVGSYSSFRQRI